MHLQVPSRVLTPLQLFVPQAGGGNVTDDFQPSGTQGAQLKRALPGRLTDAPFPAWVLNVEKIFAVLVLPHSGQESGTVD
jgi:hypothetical protein